MGDVRAQNCNMHRTFRGEIGDIGSSPGQKALILEALDCARVIGMHAIRLIVHDRSKASCGGLEIRFILWTGFVSGIPNVTPHYGFDFASVLSIAKSMLSVLQNEIDFALGTLAAGAVRSMEPEAMALSQRASSLAPSFA